MRYRAMVCAVVTATAVFAALNVEAASAVPEVDLAISKTKDGPFQEPGQSEDPPASNPQRVTEKVKHGRAEVFWVRAKNPTGDNQIQIFSANGSDMDGQYEVTFKVDGVDFTPELSYPGCESFAISPGGKVLFKMRVKAAEADPGDAETFGFWKTSGSPFCFADEIEGDIVYARVKVT